MDPAWEDLSSRHICLLGTSRNGARFNDLSSSSQQSPWGGVYLPLMKTVVSHLTTKDHKTD